MIIKRGNTLGSVSLVEFYFFLVESYPTIESFGISLGLTKFFQGVNTFSVQSSEISYIRQNIYICYLL